MSNITPDYSIYTVVDLRARVREYYPDTKSVSKMRKAELIEVLNSERIRFNSKLPDFSEVAEAAKQIGQSLSETVPSFVRGVGTALHSMVKRFSLEEQRQMKEAIYLGRYHAKRVTVRSMGRQVSGRVIDSVHRVGESGRAELLVVVKHEAARLPHPRTTLHLAEDVTLSA